MSRMAEIYLRYSVLIVLTVCLQIDVFAGSMVRTQFSIVNDGVTDSGLVNDGGLSLAIQRYDDLKIAGDSIPGISKTSMMSDVIRNQDTLIYFCADTTNNGVYYRKFTIAGTGIVPQGNWTRYCDASFSMELFFNADQGKNGSLVSFIQKSTSTKKILRIHNGTSSLNLDSTSSTGWMFSSQCALENDTFVIAYSNDMSSIKVCRIYSSGTTLQKINETTVSTGSATPGNSIMNNNVAFDGNNTIFVTWNRGAPKSAKYIHFMFLDRSLSGGVSDSIAQVSGDSTFYYTVNAGVAPLSAQQFAVFFWDNAALYLSKLSLNGGVVQKNTALVQSGNFKFCSAESNSKYVVIICKGDINGDGVEGVEGIRYPLTNGNVGTGKKFCFSSITNSVEIADIYSATIHSVIDTAGTMCTTWKNGSMSQGSVYAYRGIRYRSGFWTSGVDSLNVNYNDSLQFYPSTITVSSESSWYIEDSIRSGCTVNQCLNAPWYSFSDASVLRSIKTTCRYFQYRIKLNRKSGAGTDSLTSAIVSSITIPWNVMPVLTALDSIGIRTSVRTGTVFGDNITVMSRIDTVYPYISIRDQDTGDVVTYSSTWPSSGNGLSYTSPGVEKKVPPLTFLPLPYDTSVTCMLSVKDFLGWSGQSKPITLIARNSIPLLRARIKLSGIEDSVELTNDVVFTLQETDTITINYNVADTNDPSAVRGYISRLSGSTATVLDSIKQQGLYRIQCDTVNAVDTVRLLASVSDLDTTISYRFTIVINHSPHIDSIVCNKKTVFNNDTIRANAGIPLTVDIHVQDTDVTFWDTLQYSFSVPSIVLVKDSASRHVSFTFSPTVIDTLIRIVVNDEFGKKDSLQLLVKFPWFETDSIKNPGFTTAKNTLFNAISLIDGSTIGDTVDIPFLNTGNDSMHITGCWLKNKNNQWLKIIINADTVSSTDSFGAIPATLYTKIPLNVKFISSALNLTGDSVEIDTVFFTTEDPLHDTIIIPVKIEYNDLPQIVSIRPDYIADTPYWRLKKSSAASITVFPPHAAVQVIFSEPVDSASAVNAVTVYSVYDNLLTGTVTPITVRHTWMQNYTCLNINADYSAKSPRFGVLPPSGLYIPTDSLSLLITSNLVDKAKTPHGPNNLDVYKMFKRYAFADTTIGIKVDSITFLLLGITPLPGDTQLVAVKPSFTLMFSAPVYAQSVDTSKTGNKTLVVTSLYNNGNQLAFDSIYVNNNVVTFRIAQKLFYNDTLSCLYRSISVRNMSGFSIDMNNNGIPAADYDSLSNEDDVSWGYRVRNIKVLSVTPSDRSVVNKISPELVITFSEPLQSGSFDTSLSNNKSVQIYSLYSSKQGSFTSLSFSSDSLRVILQPADKYYSDDSISCRFTGFTKDYSYSFQSNLPANQTRLFSEYNWYFLTSNTGFYTFPNPYKPGKDPRHCGANGPCGIWFKNLHVLKRGINDVVIKIYDMNANIIYDSKKKGVTIHFETDNSLSIPQWFWDTRNMHDELTATGLYLYTVSDNMGKVLVKNKLVIVR